MFLFKRSSIAVFGWHERIVSTKELSRILDNSFLPHLTGILVGCGCCEIAETNRLPQHLNFVH